MAPSRAQKWIGDQSALLGALTSSDAHCCNRSWTATALATEHAAPPSSPRVNRQQSTADGQSPTRAQCDVRTGVQRRVAGAVGEQRGAALEQRREDLCVALAIGLRRRMLGQIMQRAAE